MEPKFAIKKSMLLCFAIGLCLGQAAQAQKTKTTDLIGLSLIELLNTPIDTGTGHNQERIADIPASVVLINRAEIARHGYRTLAETLSSIPGLYGIDQYYHESIAFGVRGFWSSWTNKQLIILVDGVPQVNPLRNNYILPQIAVPVEAIERIEVVRGPLSVVYGDGAFFGAINIITDPNKEADEFTSKDMQYDVSASVGSQNTNKLYGRVNGANKRGDVRVALTASAYNTDGIDANYDDLASADYLTRLGLTGRRNKGMLENSEKYLNLTAHIKDFTLTASRVETDMDAFVLVVGDNDGNHHQHRVSNLTLGYDTEFSKSLSLKAHLNYRENELVYDYSPTDSVHHGSRAIGEWRKARMYEGEINTTYTPVESTNLVTGVSYRTVRQMSDLIDAPAAGADKYYVEAPESINSGGVFAQLTHDYSDKLTLVAGLRLEYLQNYRIRAASFSSTAPFDLSREYDKGGTAMIPRLAAIYRPTDKHGFKFLYGEATSWPSFDQNQAFTSKPTEENLQAEKIKTLELVYDFIYSDELDMSFNLFRNELSNLIVRTIRLDPVTNHFIELQRNSGKLSTNGIEATFRYRSSQKLNMELSASYQSTKDAGTHMDAAYSPSLLGYIKAAYRIQPKMTLAVDGYYTGSMQPALDPANGLRIGDDSDGYFNLGLNFRVEDVFSKGTFASVRVSNLLNEEIRYPVFTNNEWAVKGTIGEERNFMFNVGASF